MRCTLLLLVVTGCGWPTTYLPDGGRNRVNCDTTELFVPVKVLDAAGAPTNEATVLAANSTDGRTASGVTNSAGVYKVSTDLGPGVIQVTATLNDLKTAEGNFTVTPGDCTPGVSPDSLVLQLK